MTEQPLPKKTVEVLGSEMACHERGQGLVANGAFRNVPVS